MRRAWQISLLTLYLPLWLFAFLPIAMFGLFGGSGTYFEFDVAHWSVGLWLFTALLVVPPIAFLWAAFSLIVDFLSNLRTNA